MKRNRLWRKQYSGQLSDARMVIPKEMICLLYSPQGTVSAVASPRNGSSDWTIDLSTYGKDTVVPVDGLMFGTVHSSGSGTVQYAFFERTVAPILHLDTVSPGIPIAYPFGTVIDPRDIRSLVSTDTPGRSWNLSSADLPGKSWALGSTDNPDVTVNQSKTTNIRPLVSTDTPGRAWNLGSADVPGRGWNLGSLDVPSRGWNLSSSDLPGKSWSLGTGDNPDVTVNQSKTTNIRPLVATDLVTKAGDNSTQVEENSNTGTQQTFTNGDNFLYTLTPPSGWEYELLFGYFAMIGKNTQGGSSWVTQLRIESTSTDFALDNQLAYSITTANFIGAWMLFDASGIFTGSTGTSPNFGGNSYTTATGSPLILHPARPLKIQSSSELMWDVINTTGVSAVGYYSYDVIYKKIPL